MHILIISTLFLQVSYNHLFAECKNPGKPMPEEREFINKILLDSNCRNRVVPPEKCAGSELESQA